MEQTEIIEPITKVCEVTTDCPISLIYDTGDPSSPPWQGSSVVRSIKF